MLDASLRPSQRLEHGLLTGIISISKTSILSSLNNLAKCKLLNKRFNQYYGFTENELDELDNLLDLLLVNILRQNIKQWYNVYKFGGVTIYKPWFIMMCLSRRGELTHYWIDTWVTGIIDKAFISDDVQQDLQQLIEGGDILIPSLNILSLMT